MKRNKEESWEFIPIKDLEPKKKKYSNKRIIISIIAAIFVIASMIIEYSSVDKSWSDISKDISVNQNVIEEKGNFYAHFIDVGQADCELLKCGDDTVLIDAGEVDSFETIVSYLDSQNVNKLDYLILTHMHSDHIGSAAKVIEKYKPDNIIMTRLTKQNTPTTELYKNLLKSISESSAKVIAAKPGDSYELETFGFVILAPNEDYSDLNNTSIVIKVYFGKTSFLFEGDAEMKSEKSILNKGFNVDSDVLKLGHHGSKTSNSGMYLDAVSPQIAVASCGKDNKYKHPSEETVERLKQRGISCYRTDYNGNVVVKSDGLTVSVITER